jgi:hypothetical protein
MQTCQIALNTCVHVDVESFRAPLDRAAGQLARDVTKPRSQISRIQHVVEKKEW